MAISGVFDGLLAADRLDALPGSPHNPGTTPFFTRADAAAVLLSMPRPWTLIEETLEYRRPWGRWHYGAGSGAAFTTSDPNVIMKCSTDPFEVRLFKDICTGDFVNARLVDCFGAYRDVDFVGTGGLPWAVLWKARVDGYQWSSSYLADDAVQRFNPTARCGGNGSTPSIFRPVGTNSTDWSAWGANSWVTMNVTNYP